ncbi:MAG: PIN domain-containing protein [Actinobacteria bacterium]|nr:PIN domain-containing protein [Actinomycetota bacterium]
MIILDTNVVSEVMRGPHADPGVMRWLGDLPEVPVTTVINRAELAAGIRLLPDGRRKRALAETLDIALSGLSVCLPLTTECAEHYADVEELTDLDLTLLDPWAEES